MAVSEESHARSEACMHIICPTARMASFLACMRTYTAYFPGPLIILATTTSACWPSHRSCLSV